MIAPLSREYLEQKAGLCLSIAEVLLLGASVEDLHEQTLDLMDLPEKALERTLQRIANERKLQDGQVIEEIG